jgi:hypothetical protein
MTDKQLSPTAQAVLDAAFPVYDEEENLYVVSGEQHAGMIAAAALRAVVEHCVPDDSEGHWVYIPHVLAIANELEGK